MLNPSLMGRGGQISVQLAAKMLFWVSGVDLIY